MQERGVETNGGHTPTQLAPNREIGQSSDRQMRTGRRPLALARFAQVTLEFHSPMFRGVFRADTATCPPRDRESRRFGHLGQISKRVAWRFRNEDVYAGRENRLDAGPVVTDDR